MTTESRIYYLFNPENAQLTVIVVCRRISALTTETNNARKSIEFHHEITKFQELEWTSHGLV